MMSPRKFYRTVLMVEVLSEVPYNETNLAQIATDLNEGEQVGKVSITSSNEEMTGKVCAVFLKEAGSEPGFFMLDNNGNDVFDEEDDAEWKTSDNKIKKMRD